MDAPLTFNIVMKVIGFTFEWEFYHDGHKIDDWYWEDLMYAYRRRYFESMSMIGLDAMEKHAY